MELPCWDGRFPHPTVLREEVDAMLGAIAEALLEAIPESCIGGIYFKGSAHKEWDSPLDYVPELSDLDIHLLFSDDSAIETYLGTVEQGLRVQQSMERKYRARRPNPIHVPRPQVSVLNRLLKEDDFVPSPPETVTVLRGIPYPVPDLSDPDKIRLIDCKRLLEHEEFLKTWPLRVIDTPSQYLVTRLWGVVWQVSPVGPRVAHLLGASTAEAWSTNRTRLVQMLE